MKSSRDDFNGLPVEVSGPSGLPLDAIDVMSVEVRRIQIFDDDDDDDNDDDDDDDNDVITTAMKHHCHLFTHLLIQMISWHTYLCSQRSHPPCTCKFYSG